MSNRTDIHRPSAIIPADYEFVACELVPGPFGAPMALLPERERIRKHMEATGGTYSRHEHGGNCHICGSVNLIYSLLYYHAKSNSYIRMGDDCAQKLEFGGTRELNIFRKTVREEMEIAKGKGKAQRILTESGLSRAWDVYEARPSFGEAIKAVPFEERVIADIVSKLVKYGSISVNQGAFLGKLIAKIDDRAVVAAQRAAENEAAADFPVTDARIEIVGTILSTKTVEGDFGSTFKMLVRADAGWKIWVTCPGSPAKGDKVRFFAKVQPSRDDAKFGFGSRPTKFEITQEAAQAAS